MWSQGQWWGIRITVLEWIVLFHSILKGINWWSPGPTKRLILSLQLVLFRAKLMLFQFNSYYTIAIARLKIIIDKVWIALLGSIIAVSLAMGYYIQKSDQNNNNNRNLDGYHASLIYTLAGEGIYNTNQFNYLIFSSLCFDRWLESMKKLSFRIVQGSWCLAALVLVNAYSTTLISNLVAPKLMPVSKSYEDIVAGQPQQLKLITEKNELVDRSSQVIFPTIFTISLLIMMYIGGDLWSF